MKIPKPLRFADGFLLFTVFFLSPLFFLSACEKAVSPQPSTLPPAPIESGRDLWNRLEKEDPDSLIDYDFTDEQIEQIKRDFRVEKGSDPSLPEKKIDLNGNLLFFRGIVFSGVISVRQGGEYLYIGEYRFDLTKADMNLHTPLRLEKSEELIRNRSKNPCAKRLALNFAINKAIDDVDKQENLSLAQQKILLRKLLKKIDAKYDEIEVKKDGFVVCYEKLPCNPRWCEVRQRSLSREQMAKRKFQKPPTQEEMIKIEYLRQWSRIQDAIASVPDKQLYVLDRITQMDNCSASESVEYLRKISNLLAEQPVFDKYFFLSLSMQMKNCMHPQRRAEYVFANPDYFSASVKRALGNES